MFSTKPAPRPVGPRRWFRKADPPKPLRPGSQIQVTTLPVCSSPGYPSISQEYVPPPPVVSIVHRPARSPLPPLNTQPMPNCSNPTSDGYVPRSPESFNGWMAKFCVEPPTDADACCLSFWVPFVLYGKTHWRLKQVEDGRDPTNASWSPGNGCNGPCWSWFGMCCLLQCDCVLTGFQRTRIRATYGIDGNIASDFCLSIFCRPCTMVQMDREVRAREGDMDLRTSPKARVITNQPSRMQKMRYVSPRATSSENSQNWPTNSRRDREGGACNRSSPLAGRPIAKKLPPKSATPNKDDLKPEKPKLENHDGSSKPESFHVEMSQLKNQLCIPVKATNVVTFGSGSHPSSRDDLFQRSNKEAPAGKKLWGQMSDHTPTQSQDENKKGSGATLGFSSEHGLTYCPPIPEPSSNETQSKQNAGSITGTGSSPDTKGKRKEIQPQSHVLVKMSNVDRQASESIVTDERSVVVGSSKAQTWRQDAMSATDNHELSYVHDFTDCPVDKNILEYYENEEKRSQSSQQHALADCRRTSLGNAHYSNSPGQHTLNECPEKDFTKEPKSFSAQIHALVDCPEKDNVSKAKSTDIRTHSLAADTTKKDTKAKPTCAQPHTLAGCDPKVSAKAKINHSQPHALVDCETINDPKSSGPRSHSLVDCDRIKDSGGIKSTGPQPHTLANCDHESVNTSPTEQHALADCNGDGSRHSRRASSNPESPTDRNSKLKPHRLASCPESVIDHKVEKAKIGHHVAENARVNESSDSQATVKPSSKHTLIDSIGGTQLERQTATESRPARPGSLSSLRDFIKGNQDTAEPPRKSKYHREVDNCANANGTKRPSQAQNALSQILGGNGSRKESPRDDHVAAIKAGMQSVGDKIKKRADSIGDSVKKQTDKIRGDINRGTDEVREEVKKGAESVRDEVTKQTDKIGGTDEDKSSGGFANMLSKLAPRAHQ